MPKPFATMLIPSLIVIAAAQGERASDRRLPPAPPIEIGVPFQTTGIEPLLMGLSMTMRVKVGIESEPMRSQIGAPGVAGPRSGR